MLAIERLLDIEKMLGKEVERIVPLDLDAGALRLVLYLKDGTNLRVTEQWNGDILDRYSYYWLTSAGELKIGWDNAPHHTRLETFPNHKHIARQDNLQPSDETSLDDVMAFIRRATQCGAK